ncbi:hypothetical protein C8J57DRAFT_1243830 [Mycena rebaudengoi]|nr:hypothetical protein C8J57DRAFT_1243830 [Mycena rebaudengoi]
MYFGIGLLVPAGRSNGPLPQVSEFEIGSDGLFGVRKLARGADGLSASEWLDRVKASARKARITGESRVWFTRNRLNEDFLHIIEKGLLRPLVREQREKHRTFDWNFDKLCIAILNIEGSNHMYYKAVWIFLRNFSEKAKVQRTTHTVSSTPTSGDTTATALDQAIEYAKRPADTAISHIQKVANLRSEGFGANGIRKGIVFPALH